MPANPSLELYYYDACPYCQVVLRFLDKHDLTIIKKNTLKNRDFRDELLDRGGKTQVPALGIDGEIMYESADIVDYLQKTMLGV